jgi:hypothetical protein
MSEMVTVRGFEAAMKTEDPMSDKVKVRLLVPRTGYGNRGDIVHYPAEEAARHVAMGLVVLVAEPAAAPEQKQYETAELPPPPNTSVDAPHKHRRRPN